MINNQGSEGYPRLAREGGQTELCAMELKVWVDNVQRVICGVTEKTTCQEVVIALAQAMGRPGRYTLKEKFKDFERHVSPDERLLESLNKYGQQAREVQLILNHNGPSMTGHKPFAQVRGSRLADRSRHRQSLPPVARLCIRADLQPDAKKPKRKSLTFVEEAREWIESLGRIRLHKNRDKNREAGKRDSVLSQQEETGHMIHLLKPTNGTIRDATAGDLNSGPETEVGLHKLLIQQQTELLALQTQLGNTEAEIHTLEEEEDQMRQEVEKLEHLIASRQDDVEELEFWENELRAEEVYERDLQEQFLEMKQKAAECKGKVEEYKSRLRGLDLVGASQTHSDTQLFEQLALTGTEAARLDATLAESQESLRRVDKELQVSAPRRRQVLPSDPAGLHFPYCFSEMSYSTGQHRQQLVWGYKDRSSGSSRPSHNTAQGPESTRV
ncbi:ras association domain-containing protein 8-like isoform X3 [Lepisosteus oculatus]|uniref:ras association domain-containing protein 8-like isoform X3 n=1 Tax=Lepisosteus oculatus TaxID=7918 RepID=UPI0037199CA9